MEHGNKLSNVRSFSTLDSGEVLNSFNIGNSADFSFDNTAKNLNQILYS